MTAFGQKPCHMPRGSTCLSDETIACVTAFYEEDEISRQAPGKRDYITVTNENGEKCHVQTVGFHLFTIRLKKFVQGHAFSFRNT